jgi:hypothetical protein
MAFEKRLSARLDDLTVVLICKKCQARIGYDLKSWKAGSILGCMDCRESYQDSNELLALKTALRDAIDPRRNLPCEIRLELTDRTESA